METKYLNVLTCRVVILTLLLVTLSEDFGEIVQRSRDVAFGDAGNEELFASQELLVKPAWSYLFTYSQG